MTNSHDDAHQEPVLFTTSLLSACHDDDRIRAMRLYSQSSESEQRRASLVSTSPFQLTCRFWPVCHILMRPFLSFSLSLKVCYLIRFYTYLYFHYLKLYLSRLFDRVYISRRNIQYTNRHLISNILVFYYLRLHFPCRQSHFKSIFSFENNYFLY